ncbi:MAG: FHA domain-containing protein [Lachnospiraceae bacterium]|nr:FHA domain-containing protein [Lachnospiraceae bacterium]MBQ8233939.1 FHA domain-containing protein [Lachnospiraceae bacterium]
MLQSEYIRNLNCNYERVLLDKKPEENRYQYCIVTRGGIRGLLPCSLRYINGQAYLYYDISSTQSVAQLYARKAIGRQWMKDFLWGMRRIKQELGRFLLDDANLLWYPEQIFQDLEKNDFYFLYVPYYEEENGFGKLLDYLVEHIDYEDEGLVECIYKMHEQFGLLGNIYLEERIFEDGKLLEHSTEPNEECSAERNAADKLEPEPIPADDLPIKMTDSERYAEREQDVSRENKKGIRYFLDGKRKKQKEEREQIRSQTGRMMQGYAVCEETNYREAPRGKEQINEQMEELGRTMYMEECREEPEEFNGLFNENGKEVLRLDRRSVILGKKKEEADCVLEDSSVSRMHARITKEKDSFYLEDLNSTNGTWKNGLRLQPYEKRKLEKEDEIKLGKVVLFYR